MQGIEWIETADQNPEEQDVYLVTWTAPGYGRFISVAEWYDRDDGPRWDTECLGCNSGINPKTVQIIAWMELPEMYKG